MKKSHKKAIKLFSKKAKELLKTNLEDILIYGSISRREYTDDSDIDIIVIVKKNTFKSQMTLSAIAFDILLETGEYISVQTFKKKDLQKDTIFMNNVRKSPKPFDMLIMPDTFLVVGCSASLMDCGDTSN